MFEPNSLDCAPNNIPTRKECKRCGNPCDQYENPALECVGCSRKLHVRCLRRGGVPSSIVGDVFYKFTCSECNDDGTEMMIRKNLSWAHIMVLTLKKKKKKRSGDSNRGYFHWKFHICKFINENWDFLFTRKKPKKWEGTISGVLSHKTRTFFFFFLLELNGQAGWWKLISNEPPEVLFNQTNKMDRNKNEVTQVNPSREGCGSPSTSESSMSFGDDVHSVADSSRTFGNSTPPQALDQPNEFLSDFHLTEEDFHDMDNLIQDGIGMDNKHEAPSLADLIRNFQDENYPSDQFNSFGSTGDLSVQEPGKMDGSSEEDEDLTYDDEQNIEIKEHFPEDSCDSLNYIQEQVQPSLFNISKPRKWPWETNNNRGEKRTQISEHEEAYLLQSIKERNLNSAPPSVIRLHRKLYVRKLKRQYSLRILDVDQLGRKSDTSPRVHRTGDRVLDRFVSDSKMRVFEQRLQGYSEQTCPVHSPYTNRLLKPFIRRDTASQPLWLKLMDELVAKVNKNNPNWKPPPRAPIDYSYIRPQHIPALNSLCNKFFWPGIDLSECLQYPDFSCVVSYKKLVIGFAVLVPDVGYNQAYVSFFFTRPEWRKSGIGTYMLYHLIQTCMGKDVTLHVSATNPALILYQKFGFKVEEFIQDFYDKYMSPDSQECKHALFLRLNR